MQILNCDLLHFICTLLYEVRLVFYVRATGKTVAARSKAWDSLDRILRPLVRIPLKALIFVLAFVCVVLSSRGGGIESGPEEGGAVEC